MLAREGAGSLTTRVIRSTKDWDGIKDPWKTLYESSPHASTPLDFDWLRTWWILYCAPHADEDLRIITIWRDSQLVGVAPLYVRHGSDRSHARHIRFLSTGEAEAEETCPDYLNVLCLAGEEETCANAVWTEVDRMGWDHLELLDLPEQSPLLHASAFPQKARTLVRGTCPIADLSSGFESYLASLSPNSRQQARKLIREGERAGVQFEIVGSEQASEEVFGDLVRLHQTRWTSEGKPGVFASPRFVEFHRRMIGQWLPVGRVVLARLSLSGAAVTVLYGFVTRQKFDFYQSGVAKDSKELRSPGNLAHLLLMRMMAERGLKEYDFLRGSSSYKQRLSTLENKLVGIEIWRPTLRSAGSRSLEIARRLLAKGQRSIPTLSV